jgi:hypothetical protein
MTRDYPPTSPGYSRVAPEGVAIARGEVYRERARDYLT